MNEISDVEFEKLLKVMAERPERERQLLAALKNRRGELEQMLATMSAHWTYEDPFYRFYHQSWKVYGIQTTTTQAVELLQSLLPDWELNSQFREIIKQGVGIEFEDSHNQEWSKHTRPMLEAFTHAKFMVEMAVRYVDLPQSPVPMPSGWAAFLYLYNLR